MYSFEKYVKLCHELRNKKPTPIAEAAGVQRSLISRWKGGGGITDTSALKLAEYLGVPIEALREEQKENPTVQMDSEVDELTRKLLDIAYNGTKEQKEYIVDFYETIKRREKG